MQEGGLRNSRALALKSLCVLCWGRGKAEQFQRKWDRRGCGWSSAAEYVLSAHGVREREKEKGKELIEEEGARREHSVSCVEEAFPL